MDKKELYLIRHGQSTANAEGLVCGWTDCELTEKGKSQAYEAGKRLASLLQQDSNEILVDRVLSSSLSRARVTANVAFASHEDLRPMVDSIEFLDDLREIHVGRWENMPFSKIQEQEPDLVAQWFDKGLTFSYPEGEVLEDAVKRALPHIDKALSQGQRVVVVAHGGLIGGLIAHYAFGNIAHAMSLYLENASISRIRFYEKRGLLDLLNY